MTMITASTALTIFIMNVHHCGPGAKPVPRWAKKFILQYMAQLFFVYEVGESCKSPKRQLGHRPTVQVVSGRAAKEEQKAQTREENSDATCREESLQQELLQQGLSSLSGQQDWKETGTCKNLECSREGQQHQVCVKSPCLCHHNSLLRNVEYIANCFRDQKAAQKRSGEWKKVAKVMDRIFMWVFFVMVFFMSMLIMGKAI